MPGTRAGGLNTAKTNKKLYGEDFYRKIGKIGGKKSRGGGFAAMTPEQRKEAGRKGGLKSRRPKSAIIEMRQRKLQEEKEHQKWLDGLGL